MAVHPRIFKGFYYIEGDSNGYINTAMSYADNLANNTAVGNKYTYNHLINKFTTPVILSYKAGLYVSKMIVEEDENGDRSNIQLSGNMWRQVYSIAYYIYNKFYAFVNRQFNPIDGLDMLEYIEKVLSGEIIDHSSTYSSNQFSSYKPNSFELEHVSDSSSHTYYLRLKRFKFDITWNNMDYTFDLYVNPESFIVNWRTENPFIYVYYNYDFDDQRDTIDEVQFNIAPNALPYCRREMVNAILTDSDGEDNIVSVPFYIWSNDMIPNDVYGNTLFLKSIQNTIIESEPELSLAGRVKKYPDIFDEVERVIFPLVNNKSIDETDYLDSNDNILIVNPLSVNNVNKIIQEEPTLSDLNVYETAMIEVGDKLIPLIIGGSENGAISDKVPFFRPTINQIEQLSSYDITKVEPAIQFHKYVSAILQYQVNGLSLNDIKTQFGIDLIGDDIDFVETTLYCSFSYLGIVWRVINHLYDASLLGINKE